MGIQGYNFSTIALEVARSTLMNIHGPKTEPNLLNTIDKFDRSAFPIRLQHQKTDRGAANPVRSPSVSILKILDPTTGERAKPSSSSQINLWSKSKI